MKINPGTYGSTRPKLEQADFEGDFILLTITRAEEVAVPDEGAPDGVRRSLVLEFEETGEKALWLNAVQAGSLVAFYGDESEAWIGKVVPVEKASVTFKGKVTEKVRIMGTEEWAAAFAALKVALPKQQKQAVVKPGLKVKGGRK